MLKFNGHTVSYYAIALTVVDYETTTSTTQLSRIPIEFIFKIYFVLLVLIVLVIRLIQHAFVLLFNKVHQV
jgi:uncharacterized membrane protein